MADSLEIVNKKLDELLCEFFEKVEELQKARNALASGMKNGFLLMSKARYSMGNKSVSSLQYGEKMEATATVFVKDDFLKQSGEKKENIDKNPKVFTLLFDGDCTGEEKCGTADVKSNPESVLVRRRLHNVHLTDDENKGLTDLSGAQKEELVREKAVKKSNDPLKWFGVLVPSSLRQCQQEFKSSCQLLCDVAHLESEVNRITCVYKEIKEQKGALKS